MTLYRACVANGCLCPEDGTFRRTVGGNDGVGIQSRRQGW